jgi:hypothetical protein
MVMEEEDTDAIAAAQEEALLAATIVEVPEPPAPRAMTAKASAVHAHPQMPASVNGQADTLFDELETPAILKRDRRFLH